MNSIWTPQIAQFIEEHGQSASHRRMFALGQVSVKVAAMFRLSPDAVAPDEACTMASLWLLGLESGDVAKYAECDAEAMRIYEDWRARRTLQ